MLNPSYLIKMPEMEYLRTFVIESSDISFQLIFFLLLQLLLDVVSVFNRVSTLSRKKQSVKITEDGLEVSLLSDFLLFLKCVFPPFQKQVSLFSIQLRFSGRFSQQKRNFLLWNVCGNRINSYYLNGWKRVILQLTK